MSRAREIEGNLARVRERVATAARGGSALPRLLAVSKTAPAEDVVAALSLGQTDFAESYGQEFRDKEPAVAEAARRLGLPAPRWHFIGPLQSNKVKYVAARAALVHSVATPEVLTELARRAEAAGVVQECLVQVNVAGETQKSGVVPAGLAALLDRFGSLGSVRCRGLMVIPPYDEDPERSRPSFAALRRLREEHAAVARSHVELVELSMGMSHDLEVAIAEGATMVRVGTAIFGARA